MPEPVPASAGWFRARSCGAGHFCMVQIAQPEQCAILHDTAWYCDTLHNSSEYPPSPLQQPAPLYSVSAGSTGCSGPPGSISSEGIGASSCWTEAGSVTFNAGTGSSAGRTTSGPVPNDPRIIISTFCPWVESAGVARPAPATASTNQAAQQNRQAHRADTPRITTAAAVKQRRPPAHRRSLVPLVSGKPSVSRLWVIILGKQTPYQRAIGRDHGKFFTAAYALSAYFAHRTQRRTISATA
ncbi:hypothetical protein SAMN02745704_01553 [Paucidesulfovibrio gracilis DSM 16080]|uniref:Uncharacterized protein n=1 Tax=Paucidesulfovibrio gracilis DSM 16080 TaxID=1121449 RepID=A0A1T4WYU2_9BACT|nr:hypothetical protein SAMN02745704_01553 [Paucidesulfovibrio gracilis DSM 16080]